MCNQMPVTMLLLVALGVGLLAISQGMQDAIVAPGIERGLAIGTIASHMTETQVITVWGEPDDVIVTSDPGDLVTNFIFGGPDWRQRTIWIYYSPYHTVIFESQFHSGPLYVVAWSPQ